MVKHILKTTLGQKEFAAFWLMKHTFVVRVGDEDNTH
jgi:hypothetical protein